MFGYHSTEMSMYTYTLFKDLKGTNLLRFLMGTDSGLYQLHIKLQQPKAERYHFRAKHSD